MAVRLVATAGHGMRETNGRLALSVMNIGFGPGLPSARQASEQVTDVLFVTLAAQRKARPKSERRCELHRVLHNVLDAECIHEIGSGVHQYGLSL